MAKIKRKKMKKKILEKNFEDNSDVSLSHRRSSLQVNLSFVSNLSSNSNIETASQFDNSANVKGKTERPNDQVPASSGIKIVSVEIIKQPPKNIGKFIDSNILFNNNHKLEEKEKELNESCSNLKDKIINKTKLLFDKPNELTVKTTEIFNINEVRKQNSGMKININKSAELIKSASSKSERSSMEHESYDQSSCISISNEDSDYNQSIVSTPKKSRLERTSNAHEPSSSNRKSLKATRLFIDYEPKDKPKTTILNRTVSSTGSPILSQGLRRSKLNLSLRRKQQKSFEVSSDQSKSTDYLSCSSSTSIVPCLPVTCSTVIYKDKLNTNENKKPIFNLGNENTNHSGMELTAIPITMPIVTRSREPNQFINRNVDTDNNMSNAVNKQNQIGLGSIDDCSVNTLRTSLNVNTSLDTISNLPKLVLEQNLDKKKLLIDTTSTDKNQVILKKSERFNSSLLVNTSLDSVRKYSVLSNKIDLEKQTSINKENYQENMIRNSSNSYNFEKAAKENNDIIIYPTSEKTFPSEGTSNSVSIIETTPYPVSRSVLFKTMIKTINNTETINKNRDNICGGVQCLPDLQNFDTVILDSSDEILSDPIDRAKTPVIIEESLNGSFENYSANEQKVDHVTAKSEKRIVTKRKLFPVRQNSGLVSFSASEIDEQPQEKMLESNKKILKRRKLKKKQNIQENVQNIKERRDNQEYVEEINDIFNLSEQVEKKKPKRKRKILGKKIIVKKVNNLSILNNLINADVNSSNERSSLREFDTRVAHIKETEALKRKEKMNIVVSGFSKDDRDLVKSTVKALGHATIEMNVTAKTTHVVSSGYRTINLLKGIVRGCWLVSLEWVLKSLECHKWLDPSSYEMTHFSKAVQENRRDRQIFGKAYVPELFVTCGLIYIEQGTSPPTRVLKDLVKTAGGQITEDPTKAKIVVGVQGLKEIWILDSITTGELQPINQYQRK